MTDELTPEEKEALKKLPRERMPSAGLESRVVGALRERGVLSKRRRRMIEITNSRVAGLVAACVALVIGAYAVGLQRGGSPGLPGMLPVEPRRSDRASEPQTAGRNERQPVEEQEVTAGDEGEDLERPVTKGIASTDTPEMQGGVADKLATPNAPATSAGKDDVAASKEEDRDQTRPSPASQPDEKTAAKRSREVEAEGERSAQKWDAPSAKPQSAASQDRQAPKAMMEESPAGKKQPQSARVATPAQPKPIGESPLFFPRTFSFLLNGTPVVVDAPDSVRVTRDELGQMIIIYTRDGPIRIRVADDH